MPTTFTETVGATSRTYGTITLAEADVTNVGTSGALVANDERVVFDLYNDAVFSERVTIDGGLTTDATRNVTYRAASGQQHTGTYATGVRIEASSGSGHMFTVYDAFTVFEGLEVHQYASAASSNESFRLGNASNNPEGTIIRKCLIFSLGSHNDGDGVYFERYDVGAASNPITIENNVFIGWHRCGVHGQIYNSSGATDPYHYPNVVNNTFYDCTGDGSAAAIGWQVNDGAPAGQTWNVYNNLAFDCARHFRETGSGGTSITVTGDGNVGDVVGNQYWDQADTNAAQVDISADDTAYTETTSTSPGVGDWMIFTSLPATTTDADLALVDDADNDIVALGIGPASQPLVPTEDILGNTRSGTTTAPGAFAIPAAAGDTITLDAIPSGETVHALTLVAGNADLALDTIASTEVVHSLSLTGGATLALDHIASAETVHAPTLTSAATIGLDHIASGEVVHALTLTGAGTISLDTIASAEVVHDLTVVGAGSISLDAIPSSETVHPLVLTGAGTVSLAHIASAESVPPITIVASGILLDAIASVEIVHPLSLGATIPLGHIASTESVWDVMLFDADTVMLAHIPSSEVVHPLAGLGAWYDLPVANTDAVPGSWGELIRQTHLLATYATRVRRTIQINGTVYDGTGE